MGCVRQAGRQTDRHLHNAHKIDLQQRKTPRKPRPKNASILQYGTISRHNETNHTNQARMQKNATDIHKAKMESETNHHSIHVETKTYT